MAIWQRRAPCQFTNTVDVTGVTTLTGNTGLTATAAVGAPGKGVGGSYNSWDERIGTIIKTNILVDLTGCTPAGGVNDAIGVVGIAATLGQVTTAQCGTIIVGKMTCLEAPATGNADIDLRAAADGTVVEAVAPGGEQLIGKGGNWSVGNYVEFSAVTADRYLYLVKGAGGTTGAYTAGKFLIELWGSAQLVSISKTHVLTAPSFGGCFFMWT